MAASVHCTCDERNLVVGLSDKHQNYCPTADEKHPKFSDCSDEDCTVCSARDCPHNDEMHYFSGGCSRCIDSYCQLTQAFDDLTGELSDASKNEAELNVVATDAMNALRDARGNTAKIARDLQKTRARRDAHEYHPKPIEYPTEAIEVPTRESDDDNTRNATVEFNRFVAKHDREPSLTEMLSNPSFLESIMGLARDLSPAEMDKMNQSKLAKTLGGLL